MFAAQPQLPRRHSEGLSGVLQRRRNPLVEQNNVYQKQNYPHNYQHQAHVQQKPQVKRPLRTPSPEFGFQAELKDLNNRFFTAEYVKRFFSASKCADLQRYKEVPSYADTCATADGGPATCANFLHANTIPYPGTQGPPAFVGAQAPLPHTLPRFLAVLIRLAVPIVVTILEHKELNPARQPDYWSHVPAQLPGTNLRLLGKVDGDYQGFSVRKMLAQDLGARTQQPFYHFHVHGWPDAAAPPPELHRPLLYVYGAINLLAQSGFGPTLVHCSAGIGRTGTFIVGYFIYLAHWQAQRRGTSAVVSVFALTVHVREYRPMLVASPPQYEFLHRFDERLRGEALS